MNPAPLVSIVVNNYNYASFLKEAIGSALAQTWPHKEVIVVDDGSTDDSHRVIAGFDRRIVSIFKQNGGQASAFNAGFERCRGEIVVFLDADDALLPEAIAHAVEPLRDRRVVKVHWPLLEIDGEGNHLGRLHKQKLIEGDFSAELIRRGPVALTQSPTSGNAWARWFLEQVMPLPEHVDKHGADGFLKKLCPIFGELRRLDEPQGLYRVHPANYGGGRGPAFEIRRGLDRYPGYCRLLAQHLRQRDVPFDLTNWIGPTSQYAWLRSFVTAFDELGVTVPRDETVILIDNDDLGTSILPGRRVVSFLEREGTYCGPPPDAVQAIEELERLRAEGAQMLVLAFSAFWWCEAYPELFEYLRSRYACVLDNERLLVLDLRLHGTTEREVANTEDAYTLRDGRSVSEICRAVFGRDPEQIRGLGEGSNRCRAFKVRMADRTVKCFECEDAARARTIRQATDLLEGQGIAIPHTIDVIDHVVFAEWVKGHPLRRGKSTHPAMASY